MRRLVPLALAATVAMGNLAFAEAEEPIITDIAGDANGINDQGVATQVHFGDFAGPMQASWADLLSVRVAPAKTKTELRLGVANLSPDTDVIFRVMTTIGDCEVWFQITNGASLGGSARLPSACGDTVAATFTDGVTVELDDETSEYVMTIEFAKLPAELKFIKSGAEAVGLELSARTVVIVPGAPAAPTVPQLDNALDDAAAFKF